MLLALIEPRVTCISWEERRSDMVSRRVIWNYRSSSLYKTMKDQCNRSGVGRSQSCGDWGRWKCMFLLNTAQIRKEERQTRVTHENKYCSWWWLNGFDEALNCQKNSRWSGCSQRRVDRKKNRWISSISDREGRRYEISLDRELPQQSSLTDTERSVQQ